MHRSAFVFPLIFFSNLHCTCSVSISCIKSLPPSAQSYISHFHSEFFYAQTEKVPTLAFLLLMAASVVSQLMSSVITQLQRRTDRAAPMFPAQHPRRKKKCVDSVVWFLSGSELCKLSCLLS